MMIKCVFKEDTAKWEASYYESDGRQLGPSCDGETQHDAIWNLGHRMGSYPHKYARELGEYFDSNHTLKQIHEDKGLVTV
jgi:hypothetical protein